MIRLTRLNRVGLVVSADLIEHIEMTPDTVISLTTGQRIIVRETPDEIVARVVEYRRSFLASMPVGAMRLPGEVASISANAQ